MMAIRKSIITCVALLGIAGLACDDVTFNREPGGPVAAVVVTPNTLTIGVGQTGQLNAILFDGSGGVVSGRAIAWASTNNAIATVNASGLVTGVAAGNATIAATSEGRIGAATVTVTTSPPPPPPPGPAPVASVVVAPPSASLSVGGTRQLSALVRDSAGNLLTDRTVTWSSTNNAVATVSASGLVTAHAAGTANIRATSEGVVGQSTITVTATSAAPVATVTVSPATATLTAGSTQQLSATTRDSAGNVLTGRAVSWTSDNNAIATVNSSGLVTAVAAGTARITATSEGRSGTSTITVTSAPPSGDVVSWWDDFRAGNFTSRGMQLYGNYGAIINLVSATGLGFPSGIVNVAQNVYRPEFGFIYGTDDLWPAPPVGGHVFFRMLLRQSLPAQTGAGSGGDHGFQESVGEAEIEWFWRVWHGDADSFSLEASTWQNSIGGGTEMQIDAPKNTVLRLEWRLSKTGASTGTATFRVYNNQTGALLGQSPAFPMTGMTDAKYRRARWGMSGQGGADYSGGSVYWGGIAVRVSTDANAWIGAYPTVSER